MSSLAITPIPLTQKHCTWIDTADLPLVAPYLWHAVKCRGRWYAARTDALGHRVYMHRALMSGTEMVDHRDGDGLNNARTNLRACSYSGNAANRDAQPGSATGLKGVFPVRDKFIARIGGAKAKVYLGCFTSANHAHAVAAYAARQMHGEFARYDIRAAND